MGESFDLLTVYLHIKANSNGLCLSRIKRAFLIEEQKIVVKVLKAQAQSQKAK